MPNKSLILVAITGALLISLNARPADNYDNIVVNPSFENGLNGWSPAPPNDPTHIFRIIGNTEVDGSKVLELQSTDGSFQYLSQSIDKTKILPGRVYELSVMYKTTPDHLAGINLMDANFKGKNYDTGATYIGQDFISYEAGNGEWKKLTKVFKIPSYDATGRSLVGDTWYLFLYAHTPPDFVNSDPVYYDKVELKLVPEEPETTYYLPSFGARNDDNCKSIKLGAADGGGSGPIVYNVGPMSVPAIDAESGTEYRSLKLKQYVGFQFPKFNVDAAGIPLSPMIAEIRYKDVSARPNVVTVHSRINFAGNEPLKESTDAYDIGGLGQTGYGIWRYTQFGFPVSRFPLIRAVDGKFHITMKGAPKDVPIDYVTLCKVTDAQFKEWKYKQIEKLHGFKRVALPPDVPEADVNYDDPNLVIFVRDLMKPVYEGTVPSQDELKTDIGAFSALGEIEPLSFAIYSKGGLNDLKINVSDLTNDETGDVIPAEDIELKRVMHLEKRLSEYTSAIAEFRLAYAMLPDYLEEFDTLSVGAGRPERIWLKVHVPADINGGLYQGKVDIKKDGVVLKTIAISLDVLPMKLERQAHHNFVSHDPFILGSTNKLSEAFRLARETGFEALISERIGDVKQIGTSLEFDVSQLEAKVSRMASEGMIKDYVMFLIPTFRNTIYTSLFPGALADQLYINMSTREYVTAFRKVINQIDAIADKYNFKFLYNCSDEPRALQDRRVVCDRLNEILKKNGDLTSVTYAKQDDLPLKIDEYKGVPGNQLPALTNSIDFKSWSQQYQDLGYSRHYDNYGYYTDNTGRMAYPVYNRFMHGLLPFVTDAKFVSAYYMGVMINDPYNDFDTQAAGSSFADALLEYPTLEGKLLERLNIEGVREGIKDARYIATLKKLISANPDLPIAKEAADYLAALKKKISPNYWDDYVVKGATKYGFYGTVLQNVSPDSDPNDFEAFSKVRGKLISYIKAITADAAYVPGEEIEPLVIPPENKAPEVADKPEMQQTQTEAGAASGGCSLMRDRR